MEQEKCVVVIAMDGSDHSISALKTYVAEFHKPDNRVVLVFVAQYNDISYGSVALIPGDPSLVKRIVEAEEERYKEIVIKLNKELDNLQISGEVVRVNGEPGHAILEKAKELNATYLVSGSRGLGTIRRTILGSVSGYLVHHAHIPVIVCNTEHVHHHHQHGDHVHQS